MPEPSLVQSRIANGHWHGVVLAGAEVPDVEVMHLEAALPDLSIAASGEGNGRWQVSVAIPPELLSDGVLTFVVRARRTGATLGAFSIIAGLALDEDIRAEIDLLRAELDLLKKAFRRHCVETGT